MPTIPRSGIWEELTRLSEGMEQGSGEKIWQELLEKRAEDALVHSYYASHLAKSERVDEAIAHLVKTIEDGHGTAGLWEQLIRIHLGRSDLASSRATYVQMVDAHPDDSLTERASARIAIAERRYERAAEILRSLVGKAESYETLRLMAYAEYLVGNLPAATAMIDRALAMSSRFAADAVRLKVRIHHDAEDWVQTLRTLRVLIGRNVELTNYERLMRARVLYETRRTQVGREVLEAMLNEADPLPAAAIEYARRETRFRRNQAYKYLEQTLEKHPTDADVLAELMKIDVARRDAISSLKRLNSAIRSGRAGPKVLLLRADLLSRTGDYDRAEADALRAFEAAPQLPGAVDLLLAIYTAQDRRDEARSSFEEAEAAGVLHSGARLLLGRLYLAESNVERAKAMFEKVLEEHPDNAGAKNDLAFLLAEKGEDLDRALRMAQEAQETLGKNPSAADTVGYVFYHKALYEAAIQQFRYALELSATSGKGNPSAYHYHAGLALRALGRDGQAAESLRESPRTRCGLPETQTMQGSSSRRPAPRSPIRRALPSPSGDRLFWASAAGAMAVHAALLFGPRSSRAAPISNPTCG